MENVQEILKSIYKIGIFWIINIMVNVFENLTHTIVFGSISQIIISALMLGFIYQAYTLIPDARKEVNDKLKFNNIKVIFMIELLILITYIILLLGDFIGGQLNDDILYMVMGVIYVKIILVIHATGQVRRVIKYE